MPQRDAYPDVAASARRCGHVQVGPIVGWLVIDLALSVCAMKCV
ncbi:MULTISPECIES: hypothetical protein [Micrococcales]|nr:MULTISPECIES: hypothetical protein [Micrococcales]